MQVYDWSSVPREEMSPLFTRQVIHGDTVTLARIYLKKGCVVPAHTHHNEQLSMVLEGRLKMTVAGEEVILGPGQVLHLPSNVPARRRGPRRCRGYGLLCPPA